MSSLNQKLLFEQLENFQVQRHDFLNNFQVIRGYLQLNMPEKAMGYIDEVLDSLHCQQEVYKVGQKTLRAILLSWYFDLRMKGVSMEIAFPSEMKLDEFWEKHWQEEYALQLYGYTKECSSLIPLDQDPDKLLAEIEFHRHGEGFQCMFILYNEEEPCVNKVYTASE